MTKKHRSKKFSKIFKAHVDNENHEALLNREEIEKAVAKIFMLLGAENSSLISSENSYDKSELVSLVESFHKKYDTLRQHYEDLTESLRKNVRPRSKGNGSSSFDFSSSGSESSDSESDEFSDKRKKLSKTQESKVEQISSEEYRTRKLDSGNINNDELQAMATQMHAKLEEGRILVAELAEKNAVIVTLEEEFQATKNSVKVLQTERDDLKIELESSFKQKDEMIQTMSRILEENEALRSENTAAFTRIQEADKSVEEGETKFNQIKEELNEVKSANNVLVEELETTVQQVASLKQQLTTASEEKETLRSGNSKFLRRIQETEKALADFRGQANQELASATEDLTSQNASLSSENENLKLRLESAENQVADLIQRYSAIEEENNTLKSEIVSLLSRTQEAERTIRDLTADSELLRNEKLKSQEIYNDLKQKLEVKEVEMQTLTSEHLESVKVVQQEQEKISKLSEEIKNIKDENSQLLINIGSMKLDLETSNKEVSESKQILEATQNEKHALIEENSALLSKIDQAEKVMNDLNTEKLQLEIDKSQLHMRTNYLDQELKEVNLQLADMIKAWEVTEEEKMKLAVENSGIMNKLQQMEVIIKELEQEIEVLRDEKSMLQQNQIKIQEAEKKIHDLNAETEHLKLDNSQLKIEVGALSLELEASTLRSADLNKMLGTAEEQNNTLALENSGIMSKLQQAEIILKELEKEVEKLREENSMLQQDQTRAQEAEKIILDLKAETAKLEADNSQLKMEVSALSLELEGSTGRLADLNKMLGTAEEEKKTLALENSGIMSKLQQAEITINELEEELERLRGENSIFQQEAEKTIDDLKTESEQLKVNNSQLKNEVGALGLELEASTLRFTDLNKVLETAEEEKNALALENSGVMSKLQQAEITINELEKELERLREENSIFQQNQISIQEAENDLKTESEQLKVDNSQLKKEVSTLGLELEASTLRFTDLNKVLETAEEEKTTLALENSGVMSKLQQAEITISELEEELEKLREENSMLQLNQIRIQEADKAIHDFETESEQLKADNFQFKREVSTLGLELEASTLRLTDLNKVLGTAEEEKKTLTSENSIIMSRLQQAEINVEKLENDLMQLREENSTLLQNQSKLQEAEKIMDALTTEKQQQRDDISQLEIQINELNLKLEAANLELTDLKKVTEAAYEEKAILAMELSELRCKLQQAEANRQELEGELAQLQNEISMLEQNQNDLRHQNADLEVILDGKKSEMVALLTEIEEVKKEGLDQIEAMTMHMNDLQKERDLLTTKNNELEEQIKSLTCSSTEDQTLIKQLQDELESKSLREETMLRNEKDRFDELLADYQKLEDRFRESCENLQIADRKTGELLEKLDLTVAEKADADRETAKLHQQVQTLEVQLRLSNQKFKITETENREKEESNNRKMEALRKEQREVEDRMLRFSGRIGLLENELSQLKEAVTVRIAALTNDYCGLESVFKENSVHVQKRLSECAKELKILKIWLVELKNEKEDLSVRLKYKEGIISLMKDEATSIGEKLTKKEKELASLKTQAVESEKKIKVLDEMLTEKKKEVSDRDEAKREAIRQLCLLIEYHRENSNYLRQYLSSILKRRGRSS